MIKMDMPLSLMLFFIAMAAPKPFNDLFKYDVTLFAACIVALSHAKIFTPLRII